MFGLYATLGLPLDGSTNVPSGLGQSESLTKQKKNTHPLIQKACIETGNLNALKFPVRYYREAPRQELFFHFLNEFKNKKKYKNVLGHCQQPQKRTMAGIASVNVLPLS